MIMYTNQNNIIMSTQTQTEPTIYKNVELKGFRTVEIIDTIIENVNNGVSTKQIAENIGIENFRPLIGIIRKLNQGGYINTKPKTIKKPKTVIKTAKNTFKNYYGSGKDKARDLIANAIMSTKRRNSNVLTLPADTWIMEKNILKKKNGYKFTAVERDKETYKQMLRNLVANENLSDAVISTINKTIGEVVEHDCENTYSSAILDYCGFIDSFYDEINYIMKHNLVKKDGYITITLAENDRALNNPLQANNYSNRYIKNCYVGEEITGSKVTIDLMNNLVFNNNNYAIESKFEYKDKRVKMLLFIIKRID